GGAAGAGQFADPDRLASLAVLYAQLASSDPVRKIMRREGPVTGTIEADAIVSRSGLADALPFVQIAAIDSSPGRSLAFSTRATHAFGQFLEEQQRVNAIPPKQRVVVTVIKQPRTAKLLSGRSFTIPIVVFLSVMVVVFGFALVLENTRPAVRAV